MKGGLKNLRVTDKIKVKGNSQKGRREGKERALGQSSSYVDVPCLYAYQRHLQVPWRVEYHVFK